VKVARHVPRIRWKRPPSSPVRLSAFVDARGHEADAPSCVASLRDEWNRDRRRDEDLEVFVLVDAPRTERAFEVDAHVVELDAGVSRAQGLAEAIAHSRGAARDVVAVLAPDVVFLPGSLTPLLQRLQSDPECGAVAPRRFLDEALQFQPTHPPEPSPFEHLWLRASRRFAFVARRQSRRMRARNWTFWSSVEPIASDSLAEPCVFLRRKALARARGLFHAARAGRLAHLDLMSRVAEQGYSLVYEPRSRVLGRVADDERDAATGMTGDAARDAYVRRHGGFLGRWAERCATWLDRRSRVVVRGGDGVHAELGPLTTPPVLEIGRNVNFAIELEHDGVPGVVAGSLGQGAHFAFADAAWNRLVPGDYRVKAVDRDSGRLLGAWSLTKARARDSAPTTAGPFAPCARPS